MFIYQPFDLFFELTEFHELHESTDLPFSLLCFQL